MEDVKPGDVPEEVEARAWLSAHSHDPGVAGAALPQDYRRDPETGETISPAPSGWLSQQGWEATEGGREHRPVLSIHSNKGDVVLWERLSRANNPLLSQGGRSSSEMDVRVRLDRAMAKLREDQQDILRMRFFEGMTLEEVAAEQGVTKQAVHYRMQVAIQDLYVAITSTWHLPYDVVDELFGIRAREGRPSRDRDGEQQAAELTIASFFASRKEAEEDE